MTVADPVCCADESSVSAIQSTTILVADPQLARKHTPMMEAVWKRLMDFQGCSIQVFPKDRDNNGFLEWCLLITMGEGQTLVIGAIQRAPGASVEFHS